MATKTTWVEIQELKAGDLVTIRRQAMTLTSVKPRGKQGIELRGTARDGREGVTYIGVVGESIQTGAPVGVS